MSLDLTITTSPCKECGHIENEHSFNYTYNVSPMWYEIYPEDTGMVQIEGMTGAQALSKLQTSLEVMIKRSKFMKKLSPENGWGSYEGFLDFLRRIRLASEDFPDGIWSAYR